MTNTTKTNRKPFVALIPHISAAETKTTASNPSDYDNAGPICRACGEECDEVLYRWDREARVYDTYCSALCRGTCAACGSGDDPMPYEPTQVLLCVGCTAKVREKEDRDARTKRILGGRR